MTMFASVFLPIAARTKTELDFGVLLIFACAVVVIGVPWLFISAARQEKAKEERRLRLLKKYGNSTVAENIIAKRIWTGETTGQLRDSLGSPADIDQKVMKTKTKEIWKYYHKGGNRYGLRITVENGVIVGWDERL